MAESKSVCVRVLRFVFIATCALQIADEYDLNLTNSKQLLA